MVDTELLLKEATFKIEEFAEAYTRQLQNNLSSILKTEAIPAIKEAYLSEYDTLVGIVESLTPSRISGEDPLSLRAQRPLFVKQLSSQLEGASFDGNEFSVSIKLTGDENETGIPSSPSSLNFYIEGAIGEYAFITPELLKKRRPESKASRGRLGQGFIISKRNYEREKWEQFTGVSFSEVRHPISGFRPYREFEKVPESIDFSIYIKKALEKTNESFKSSTL